MHRQPYWGMGEHPMPGSSVVLLRTGSLGDSLLAFPLVRRLLTHRLQVTWVVTERQRQALEPLVSIFLGLSRTDPTFGFVAIENEREPLEALEWLDPRVHSMVVNLDWRPEYAELAKCLECDFSVGRNPASRSDYDFLWIPVGTTRTQSWQRTIAAMYEFAVFGYFESPRGQTVHNVEDRLRWRSLDFRPGSGPKCPVGSNGEVMPFVGIHFSGRAPHRRLSEDTASGILKALRGRGFSPVSLETMPIDPMVNLLLSPHLAGVISVATGPMHLAYCLNVPTLGLFTHDRPANWGHPLSGFRSHSLEVCHDCLHVNGGAVCTRLNHWVCAKFDGERVLHEFEQLLESVRSPAPVPGA